ncbi:uncharacterized protein A1O9_12519 [Exophiala aquamarina CBS 119918]|uniref:Mitochondrial chaperone BCS1-like ATPase lid domain-containing protein n=1 Tax=Exophiala aquamarina CBS 119918 TaxID=1182545 RepID=A0A072P707_9EURO|nr:uncharacterized protein A1O9_12519 [Exophiala aquamarina CBS 119918]KEF51370.1 hypothetical protein A1O9_12519 [Exophiala aquamarina CBS 119918]
MYTPHSLKKPARFDTSKIPKLVDLFANTVPAGEFTPAKIQQVLLVYRIRPQAAVDRAVDFVRQKLPDRYREPSFAVTDPKYPQPSHLLIQGFNGNEGIRGTAEEPETDGKTALWVHVSHKRRHQRRAGELSKLQGIVKTVPNDISAKGIASETFLFLPDEGHLVFGCAESIWLDALDATWPAVGKGESNVVVW